MATTADIDTLGDIGPGVDLSGRQLIGADLAGRDLRGCTFDGLDLSKADLSGAKLTGSSFVGSSLHETNLDGAQMIQCDFTGADLTNCSAVGAQFGSSNLTAAALFGANLADASLTRTIARDTDFRAANLDRARVQEADLRGADLSRATLRNSDLFSSKVDGAHFSGADLSGARLRHLVGYDTTDWIGVDILNVDFAGSYMVRREIIDQNYLHEFRNRSARHGWFYRLWWLTSDCGRSFARWGGVTLFCATLFGVLYQFVDIDYGSSQTALSPYYFSVVTLTTLGYGDVLPNSIAAQMVVIVEVIVGYVMLGGGLSIFANKMSRRAD